MDMFVFNSSSIFIGGVIVVSTVLLNKLKEKFILGTRKKCTKVENKGRTNNQMTGGKKVEKNQK